MGVRVGGIFELAGDKAAGGLARQLLCLFDGAGHPPGAGGEHQLGPIGHHQLATLHRHGVRHDDDHPVAPGRRHRGKADAGVAAGGLNNGAARADQALRLGIIQHGLGHPVLHRTGGIEGFQLCQQHGIQAQLLFQADKAEQGSAADQLIRCGVDLGHGSFSFSVSGSIGLHPVRAPRPAGSTSGQTSGRRAKIHPIHCTRRLSVENSG